MAPTARTASLRTAVIFLRSRQSTPDGQVSGPSCPHASVGLAAETNRRSHLPRCGSGAPLAVDVGATASSDKADFADSRRGWALLWDRLRGRGPSGPPSLITTLLRTIVVNSEHHLVHHDLLRLADLVLTPDVQA